MKKRLVTLGIGAALAVGLLGGCAAQGETAAQPEQDLTAAIASSLESAGYGTYVGGQTYETGLAKNADGMPLYTAVPLVNGYLAAVPGDFDGDGAEEALVVATDQAQGEYEAGFGTNTIKLLMLENTNGSWEVVSDYVIDNVLLVDDGRFDVFYQSGDQPTIFIENCFISSTAADGLCYNLYPITYTDGLLAQGGEILAFAGSAELDRYLGLNLQADTGAAVTDEEQSFVDNFTAWGFAVTEIGLDKAVMDTDPALVKVARIKTAVTVGQEQLMSFYNDAAQTELLTTTVELVDCSK